MKYSQLVQAQPIGVQRAAAAAMVGGEAVLSELLDKKLIRPRISRHRLTVFDVNELRQAWDALTKTPGQSLDHSAKV